MSPKIDGEIKDAPCREGKNSAGRAESPRWVLIAMGKVEFVIILIIYWGSAAPTRE